MMAVSLPSRWVVGLESVPDAAARLFCLPSAGAGSAMYRPWMALAPAGLEVCPVQLPGREIRITERAFTRIGPLVDALHEAIRPSLDRPFGLFGHSMGALVAFELARRVRDERSAPLLHLFVSGMRAPHLPDSEPPIYALPDAEFLDRLQKLNGTPAEIFQHPELMQLLLPVLRADLTLCDTYTYADQRPLDCPITALGGSEDPKASAWQLDAWARHTTAAFRRELFQGDHFYLAGREAELLKIMAAELVPPRESVRA